MVDTPAEGLQCSPRGSSAPRPSYSAPRGGYSGAAPEVVEAAAAIMAAEVVADLVEAEVAAVAPMEVEEAEVTPADMGAKSAPGVGRIRHSAEYATPGRSFCL